MSRTIHNLTCLTAEQGKPLSCGLASHHPLMDNWAQLLWNRVPETDAHQERARDPYEGRHLQGMDVGFHRRTLRITDFVSQYAIGDNLTMSKELLLRSRLLLDESKAQILKCRMRLLMSHSGAPSQ
jgi:hypothetical protein